MGTTMTMAYSLGIDLFVVHVGDSRAYRFHQGQLQQLTRDHTLAQKLPDLGKITRGEAASHRLRHVLTNSLGRPGDDLPVDVQRLNLSDGDSLLLCSDGQTEMVEEPDISDMLGRHGSAEDACRTLVDRALERGGTDNVTVIVARYCFPDSGA
jgi:protein phosphatase